MRYDPAVAVYALAILAVQPVRAEIVSASPSGFEVREAAHVSVKPAEAFASLGTPSRWWSPDHTYSKSAANLALELRAGGCWCETLLDGGSVQHMIVVNVQPGKMLRLRGALGPLQSLAVDGAMTIGLVPDTSGTAIEMTYAVGGYSKDGLDKLAPPVDHVLGDQIRRLKALLETGSPETTSPAKKEKP